MKKFALWPLDPLALAFQRHLLRPTDSKRVLRVHPARASFAATHSTRIRERPSSFQHTTGIRRHHVSPRTLPATSRQNCTPLIAPPRRGTHLAGRMGRPEAQERGGRARRPSRGARLALARRQPCGRGAWPHRRRERGGPATQTPALALDVSRWKPAPRPPAVVVGAASQGHGNVSSADQSAQPVSQDRRGEHHGTSGRMLNFTHAEHIRCLVLAPARGVVKLVSVWQTHRRQAINAQKTHQHLCTHPQASKAAGSKPAAKPAPGNCARSVRASFHISPALAGPLPPAHHGSCLALREVPPPAVIGFDTRLTPSLVAVPHPASPHPSEEEGDTRQAFKGARYCRQEEGHRQGQGKGYRCRTACCQEISTPDHVDRGPSGMCTERCLVERPYCRVTCDSV